MSRKYDLSNKVALVTGSSSGIGAAIAVQLAQYGARVAITGRDATKLDKVAQQIEQISSGVKPLQIIGDLLDETFPEKLVQQTVAQFGRLDILVNNAGAGTTNETFASPNLMEGFDKVIGLNLKSVIRLIQLAIPELEKCKGNVVNISSIAAIKPYLLVYSASKAALDMVTKCAAQELGPKGIRVNSINPGPVWTAFGRSVGNDQMFHQYEEMVKKRAPLGRIASPEEIANLASFLVSNDACNLTGSIIVSDGGIINQSMVVDFEDVVL